MVDALSRGHYAIIHFYYAMPKFNKNEDYFTLLDEVIESLLDLGLVLHIRIADNPSYGNLLRTAKEEGVKIV